jgi:hypothetical protein
MLDIQDRLPTSLPETLPLHADESYLGYLSRVAQDNLRTNAKEIAMLAGAGEVTLAELQRIGTGEAEIAKLCGVDPSDLRNRRHASEIVDGEVLNLAAGDISRQLIRLRNPRIAPNEYRRIGYHRYEWDFKFLTFDTQTGEKLIDGCSLCGNKFSWSRPNFLRCEKCDEPFATGMPDLVDEDSRTAGAVFSQLLSPIESVRSDARQKLAPEVRDLSNTVLFQFLFQIFGIRGVSKVSDAQWVTTLIRAYQVATEWPGALLDAIEKKQLGALASEGRFGGRKTFGDLGALLCDWDVVADIQAVVLPVIRRYLAEHPEVTLKPQSRLANLVDLDTRYATLQEIKHTFGWSHRKAHRLLAIPGVVIGEARGSGAPLLLDRQKVLEIHDALDGLVSKRTIRDVWGLPHEAVNQFVTAGIFREVDAPYVALLDNVQALFRRSDVVDVFERVLAKPNDPYSGDGTFNFNRVVREIGREIANPWVTVIQAVLNGELKAVRISEKKLGGFRRVRFDKKEVAKWISKSIQQSEITLSQKEVSARLHIHLDLLRDLILNNYIGITAPRAGERGARISISQVEKFDREYVSSGHLASELQRSSKVHSHLLVTTLEIRGVDPLPRYSTYRRIYRRADIPSDFRVLQPSEMNVLLKPLGKEAVSGTVPWSLKIRPIPRLRKA